jgi:hypothetical protein
MTEEQFIQKIEGAVNDAWDGASTREEAFKGIMKLFFETLDPLLESKNHLELFIYRVKCMRDLQEKYFRSNHNRQILAESMKVEKLVDHAMKVMLSDHGYSIEKHIDKEKQQQNLFAG